MISPRNPSGFPRTRHSRRPLSPFRPDRTLLTTAVVALVFLGLLALAGRESCVNGSYAHYMGEACSARFTQ